MKTQARRPRNLTHSRVPKKFIVQTDKRRKGRLNYKEESNLSRREQGCENWTQTPWLPRQRSAKELRCFSTLCFSSLKYKWKKTTTPAVGDNPESSYFLLGLKEEVKPR